MAQLLNLLSKDERSKNIHPSLLRIADYLGREIPESKDVAPEQSRRKKWVEAFLDAYKSLPAAGSQQLDDFCLWIIKYSCEVTSPNDKAKEGIDLAIQGITEKAAGAALAEQVNSILCATKTDAWYAYSACRRAEPDYAKMMIVRAAAAVSQPATQARRDEIAKRRPSFPEKTRLKGASVYRAVTDANLRARGEFFHRCMLELLLIAKPAVPFQNP